MLWLAARSLLARRISTAVTGLGLLIATLGFNLLASTSQTATAVLHGDIASAWSTPYDLLVRPRVLLGEHVPGIGLNHVYEQNSVPQLPSIRQALRDLIAEEA